MSTTCISLIIGKLIQNNQEEEEREGAGTLLYSMQMLLEYSIILEQDNKLGRLNNRQTLPDDVIEFIDLCETGNSL